MQFVDHVRIEVESGSGGDGTVAWRREKFVSHGGPAGGDGGHGGSVYIEASPNLHTLLDFKYKSHFKGGDGERGRSKNQHGKAGDDLSILVPCGTVVKDAETDLAIADMVAEGERVLLAVGGRGGRGNSRFTTSRRQAPQFAEPGEAGICRVLELELKLIADVGLLGMPNAGKSTLISVISAAKPKIADYPFTTLTPNLGMVRSGKGGGFLVADIPGLIEGASQGAGLGHEFLRHVERTRLLLHLIDISDAVEDIQAPLDAWQIINTELDRYSPTLAQKPQLVVLTKTDAVDDSDRIEMLKSRFSALSGCSVYAISAVTHQGVDALMEATACMLETLPPSEAPVEIAPDVRAFANDDSAFEIRRKGKVIHVMGGKLERLVRVTDFRNLSATRRVLNIFKAMGVYAELKREGVQPGQMVVIGGYEFEYQPD
jgi:GTP-binding protein